ncbi:NTP transferase domain-containing protein [Kluyvera sp. STS39-E]|uniref:nucleotidyltransferase family protein n=1 Tax=Enterobacteriaceae TaxID=543 RepID=UPI000E3E19CE|nr:MULTISPECIES: nucleotidyltransferase family protein [Citrobacter]MBD0826594.1 nucleotidyltransferase family protein [Citrobacter sp. C1]RFU93318.1 nucleotidyltransferase family protein [Citrobacter gillenii]
MVNPGIILLAAGLSRRYHKATGRHKLLELIPGTTETIFQRSLTNALLTGLKVTVVIRSESQQLKSICQKLNAPFVMVNSLCMGDSIAEGIQADKSCNGWLISLADLPSIAQQTYKMVAGLVCEGQIVRPYYHEKPGHPVGFPVEMKLELLKLQGHDGARKLLKSHPVLQLNTQDSGCIWDIDLPDQLNERVINGGF